MILLFGGSKSMVNFRKRGLIHVVVTGKAYSGNNFRHGGSKIVVRKIVKGV